jgi:predicted NBD/HSP70 family sugar kinase
MNAFIGPLSLLLKTNELGLAISNLVLSLAYMLTVVIGRPFTHTFDNVLEAATTGVQAYGILLSIVRLVDENAISEYTGEVTRPIYLSKRVLPVAGQ